MRAATAVKNGCAFLFVVFLVLNALNALGQLVYTNDFTTTPGSEWSLRNTSVTPAGARRFLEIDVSADLDSWTTLTNLSTTAFHTPVRDWDANNFQQRFYRAVLR